MPFFLNSKPRNAALLSILAGAFCSFGSIDGAENGTKVATKIALASTNSTNIAHAGQNFTIPDLNLDLIWVRPGTFTMGSASDEPHRNKAEGPQTQVKITGGFWLGKTEVTQGQYETITGENPSAFKNVGTNAPVERVSWVHAMNFCKKLNDRERNAGRLPEGYAYTLPTEAQWEYAYRAGTTSEYPGDPEAMAWHEGNSRSEEHTSELQSQ